MDRPQQIYQDPATKAYGQVPPTRPGLHSYPPSYSSDPSIPVSGPQQYHLPLPTTQSQTTEPLLKRLSLRLVATDPNYKTPEQLAEEDRSLDAEEQEMLRKGMINWREMRRWRFWIRKEWWGWYIAFVVCA